MNQMFIDMLMKSMGLDPEETKQRLQATFATVATFNARLTDMQRKVDDLYYAQFPNKQQFTVEQAELIKLQNDTRNGNY